MDVPGARQGVRVHPGACAVFHCDVEVKVRLKAVLRAVPCLVAARNRRQLKVSVFIILLHALQGEETVWFNGG